jgi:hypothetical protein
MNIINDYTLTTKNITKKIQDQIMRTKMFTKNNEPVNHTNITFIGNESILINNKFVIKKMPYDLSCYYILSNINTDWKENFTCDINIDKLELDQVHNKKDFIIMNFSLWSQDKYFGKIKIKLNNDTTLEDNFKNITMFLTSTEVSLADFIR